MRTTLSLLAMILVLAAPALAQVAPAPSPAQSPGPEATAQPHGHVEFALEARLTSQEYAVAPIPIAVLDRLTGEQALTHVRIDHGRTLRVMFAFPDLERFRSWYASGSTRELLELLGAESVGPVAYNLQYSRRPVQPGN